MFLWIFYQFITFRCKYLIWKNSLLQVATPKKIKNTIHIPKFRGKPTIQQPMQRHVHILKYYTQHMVYFISFILFIMIIYISKTLNNVFRKTMNFGYITTKSNIILIYLLPNKAWRLWKVEQCVPTAWCKLQWPNILFRYVWIEVVGFNSCISIHNRWKIYMHLFHLPLCKKQIQPK